MNQLKDITFQVRYRSGDAFATPHEFYNKILPCTKIYKRAVGFFSSTSFLEISYGILSLVKNDGKMFLITSPKLNEDDVVAIQKGYKEREKIYLDAFKREMLLPKTINEQNRFNILANLIENGILEIKIAVTKNPKISMYHEKIGLFEDEEGNKVAISGSNNESETAISENFESFQVFCGWCEGDKERVNICENDFDAMWSNVQKGLDVFEFPELPKELIRTYKTEKLTKDDLVKKADSDERNGTADSKPAPNVPTLPHWVNLHDYQKEAINNWVKQDYRGIFDMATGTGKTLTGLSALTKLYEDTCGKICVVILCPYIHLVMQWLKDIESFNIKPIIAFGESPQKDWYEKLKKAVARRNFDDSDTGFFCLVSTIATFKREKIQSQIAKLKRPILLIADEAHNLGASNTYKYFDENKFKYRLALSATLERHFDEAGTQFLYDFFGKKCIEYDLGRAIQEGYLTPYTYYPVVVFLDEKERESYRDYTKSISTEVINDSKTGKTTLTPKGKMLCIQRSRVIAGCKAKIPALLEQLLPYKDKNMILIYCGATSYNDDEIPVADDSQDVRQISEVIKRIYEKYKMSISKFTAKENAAEREILIKKFSEGKELQALTAIKCLDEGVNIPSVKTAFILASSTNPKEYIQRRGRVLRLADGKDFAEIYDFITLPYEVETVSNKTEEENFEFKALAFREVTRMKEFSTLAMNRSDSYPLIEKLEKIYGLKNKTYKENFIDE